jgi:hypothetical protein
MTKGFSFSLALAATLAASTVGSAAEEIKTERGRLQELIARLASSEYVLGEPLVDPRPYVDPTPILHGFRHLAAALAWGNVQDAAVEAAKLDYQIVKFVDAATERNYYVLREDLSRHPTSRGWGSYILSPDSQVNVLVEVPHPIADAQTPEIGGAVFERADAKGFLLAGAHRLKADVPDLVDSIFHQVHTAWVGPNATNAAWQIHGFASYKHEFPDNVQVIASTGDGAIRPELAVLDEKLEREGFGAYVFNERPVHSSANRRLNGDVSGVIFSSLAATTNEQGRQSRSLGGAFVHVELESQVRLDAEQAERAASMIAAAMSEPSPKARLASNAAQVTLASYAPPAEPLAEGGSDDGAAEAPTPTVVDAAVEVAATDSATPGSSEPVDGDASALELARSRTAQPERADGSRPRRSRKPTS